MTGKNKIEVVSHQEGVLQGDITSSLYFILVMEMILHMYDPSNVMEDLDLVESKVNKLTYSDDVMLLDSHVGSVNTKEAHQHVSMRPHHM